MDEVGEEGRERLVRWETHSAESVALDGFGLRLEFSQDPDSEHLGSTVWDSSIVTFKYLEKNADVGGHPFSRAEVAGRHCIELGAGMGLGGTALALLGGHVTLTDQPEVVPRLRTNSQAVTEQMAAGGVAAGRLSALELLWGDGAQAESIMRSVNAGAPFDLVLCSDCVYHVDLVSPLLQTVLQVSSAKAAILVTFEVRCPEVHQAFLDEAKRFFKLHPVAIASMDQFSQSTDIKMYHLEPKPGAPRRARRAAGRRISASVRHPANGDTDAGVARARRIGSGEGILAHALGQERA